MMDRNFIGLIVSVYNETKATLTNNIEIICFQGDDYDSSNFTKIPIRISVSDNDKLIAYNLQNLFKIPKLLLQEENNSLQNSSLNTKNFLCTMSNIGSKIYSSVG